MKYNIRGENIEVTAALREYVEKKIDKLERFFESNAERTVNVNLKVYPDKHGKIEVTIPMPKFVLRAEEEQDDLYVAIDLVGDKLERQIRKHKTKANRKLHEKGEHPLAFAMEVPKQEFVEDEEDYELVRTKRFDLKPMDKEEAILQMNMLGHNFYVFANGDTNETNVVYRRKDGRYGLIEAN